jgi:hypothetical protein
MRIGTIQWGLASVTCAAFLLCAHGAAGQGKGQPPPTTYTVVYRNAPADAVKTNVASLQATRNATGFDLTSSGSNLEINLGANSGITPTPVAPNIACGNNSENESCLLAAQSDKIRNVGSMKLYVMDCATQTELAGLEAIPEGGSACARIAYFISDLGSLNWAARFNPENPSWAQSRYLAIERGTAGMGTANTWNVETQPESSGPCVEGDCAGVTRNKTKKNAKGVVIEGFFHVPHAFTVTKN